MVEATGLDKILDMVRFDVDMNDSHLHGILPLLLSDTVQAGEYTKLSHRVNVEKNSQLIKTFDTLMLLIPSKIGLNTRNK